MQYTLRSLLCCLALLLFMGGCGKEPIRHLSSDACLISQGTTKKDVLAYMGTPQVTTATEAGEVWIFVEEHKSLLKKTPVLNWAFGSATYDLVYITFSGDMVTDCQYRAATEKQYEEALPAPEPTVH